MSIGDDQHRSKKQADPRTTEELVRLALTERDEQAAWEPVTVLHWRGSREVFEVATKLCASSRPDERRLGVNILGQLGIPDRTFPDECFKAVAGLLPDEQELTVLECIGYALGHLRDPRGVEVLLPFVNHPDAAVRYGVVSGLTGQEHPDAIRALIQLSCDTDEDVRDWATFGLGSQISTDTPEIREALLARTADTRDETRGEALVGLAERKDARVMEPLLKELTSKSVGVLAVEAATLMRDARLHPALVALKSWWATDSYFSGILDAALAACAPSGETR